MLISKRRFIHNASCAIACAMVLGACTPDAEQNYPTRVERERVNRRGKITGDGLSIFGGSDDTQSGGGASPIGVNSFLWRATLDTIHFLPLASADPFGGVIITDWHSDPATPTERFKLTILILDTALRSDALKVSMFKQIKTAEGWQDSASNPATARKIEDTILTRARELRIRQSR